MIVLDTRELDHPMPLEIVTDAFKNLGNAQIIHMIHRREPIPLFEIITKNGGHYLSYEDSEQIWHIYITRNGDLEEYRV
ncbi:MAG: DUF2249 domain-containing protein [Sulfuricurvum sp.]|nr:DUF2249 domain-containing protein [Sulfuricurvum sp.]